MQQQPSFQDEMFKRRLPVVIIALAVAAFLLMARLISFQFQYQWAPEVENYLTSLRNSGYNRTLRLAAARGIIYDRDMQALAVNTLEYRIGISPNLVSDPRGAATQLAALLNLDELETFEKLAGEEQYVLLAPNVNAEIGQQIDELRRTEISALRVEPVAKRSYPQGSLAAQVIGFVGGDLRGYYGVEGFYQEQLAGRERDQRVSNIPFDLPQDQEADRGSDIVLTIDRDIQHLIESELQASVIETGATGGTIIVMNPRNGDILAMASYPTFDPNAYFDIEDASLMVNQAISEQYEPGSVMKILTVASAIDLGIKAPTDGYMDTGSIEIGGINIQNWDRAAHGWTDMTQLLVQSLNVGAATVSRDMGPQNFYDMFGRFGMGRPTGIDLQGEGAGTMYVPGDPDWSESQLGTASFGQGIATTPLQMLVAVNAVANEGRMMQPHVVHQIIDGDRIYTSQPSTLGRPISAETADVITDMMVAVVRDGLDGRASVAGYTIAGKTGTAQISTPIGYEAETSIVSFIGFMPADDPQVSVLIKLDRPAGYWGSQVAAPLFQRIAERLVILLKIPPDDVRLQLSSQGGVVGQISR